ncbi:hypothetical protein ONZ45_g18261 [Pleurotus djamor]|nr:hypothetical protein ONZ45_g18261 [Pleurotus djamor]
MTTSTTTLDFSDATQFRIDPPAKKVVVHSPNTITIQALPETDYWRIPKRKGEDAANRHNGAFLSIDVDATKEFEAGVWIKGEWRGGRSIQYDQGCLMIVAGTTDGTDESWVKMGVEVDKGSEWVGTVVASPWSDWSIQPAKTTEWVLIKAIRLGTTLQIFHFFADKPVTHVDPDSPDLQMMREVKGFDAQAQSSGTWRVGVMVCGPKNAEGTEATFEGFYTKYL